MSELIKALMADPSKKTPETLVLRIPSEMLAGIAEIAEKTGHTKSNVVRTMIAKCLKELEA
jgi:predicted DNA-binding protein